MKSRFISDPTQFAAMSKDDDGKKPYIPLNPLKKMVNSVILGGLKIHTDRPEELLWEPRWHGRVYPEISCMEIPGSSPLGMLH